jgi:PAS domain S-box-containing protein
MEKSVQSNPDNKALLLKEQVGLLFSAIPSSVVANIIGSMLAIFMYKDMVSPWRLYPWIALLLLTTLGRFLHYLQFRRRQPGAATIDLWFQQFRIGSLVMAGVVGSAGFLLFVYDNSLYQLVLALMLVCIASFAITTMAPSTELVLLFLVLLLAPLTGSLLLMHGFNGLYAIWMVPVSLVMLALSSIRISSNIKHNIVLTLEARKREQDLQNFQQRLALYFQDTPLAALELNPQSEVVKWNPAAEKMFGYTRAEAEGQPLTTLLASVRSQTALDGLWADICNKRASQQVILENRCKNGALLQCEWLNTPLIEADGKMIAVISLVQNVTERLENERIKQEFISIVSHELRTPVTSIKGSLALLDSGIMADDPAKSSELLRVALDNTNRLHMLVNDILDVEKLESGRMDYRLGKFDLCKLIRQVVAANESLAVQSNLRLVCQLPAAPCNANIDPDRIFQVLTNLLANAIKFSHAGAEVTISLDTSGERAKIGILNFGEVIPDKDRAKLFTKFFQRDSTATRAKGGSGLGLYICQKILAEHQSRLEFTSTAEAGTLFFFFLSLSDH